jgi:hypothetical protein
VYSLLVVEGYDRFTRVVIADGAFDIVSLYRLLAVATILVTHGDGYSASAASAGVDRIDASMLAMEKLRSEVEFVLDDDPQRLNARPEMLPKLKKALLKAIMTPCVVK